MQVIWFKSLLSLTGSQKQEQIHYYHGSMCSDGFILWDNIILPSHCFFLIFRQEEKKKFQSGERLMKDERILNLQKKIVEKTMERKKQAGLLKIIPQKTRIVSSKVWLLHKEKSSAIDLLFTDLCSTASTGKGQRQMVPYMAGSSNTLSPA